jgi:predicted DCC family thiol-disulfide oxidoreductase YuxK
MSRLTVFYDPRCGLCCAIRDWIAFQRQIVPLVCHPKAAADGELVVVADSGEVWSGDAAWLMVLWALDEYREWALRLASPALLPVAKRLFRIVSGYRGELSCRLGLAPDESAEGSSHARSTS